MRASTNYSIHLESVLTHARHMYSAVIRAAITYGSTVKHALARTKDERKSTTEKSAVIQNRHLRELPEPTRQNPSKYSVQQSWSPLCQCIST